jgi:hypothetical protein
MVTTVRPKAKETPANPMPSSGNPAARTALPHPPKTNQKVPINSASNGRVIIAKTPKKIDENRVNPSEYPLCMAMTQRQGYFKQCHKQKHLFVTSMQKTPTKQLQNL